MIKNFIFDLGKVLINNDPSEYLRKYGYDEEKYQALLDAIWTDSLWGDMDVAKYESFKDIIETYVEKHKELEPELRRFFADDWMELYVAYDDTVKFYNEVYEQGYDIYLLTNFSKDGYEYISNKFDFFKKAKGAVVSSQLKIAKPDMRIYKYLLETYNLNPDKCIFIDDSVANIKAAKALGIHGIVYTDIENLKNIFGEIIKLQSV